jgi:hypothetical protein
MAFAKKQEAEAEANVNTPADNVSVTPDRAGDTETEATRLHGQRARSAQRASNAERQARYRERVKATADKYAPETPVSEEPTPTAPDPRDAEIVRLKEELAQQKEELARLFNDGVQLRTEKMMLEEVIGGLRRKLSSSNTDDGASAEGAFSKEEWSILIKCLHPDTNPSQELKTQATQLLNVRKARLVRQPSVETSAAEMDAKARHARPQRKAA